MSKKQSIVSINVHNTSSSIFPTPTSLDNNDRKSTFNFSKSITIQSLSSSEQRGDDDMPISPFIPLVSGMIERVVGPKKRPMTLKKINNTKVIDNNSMKRARNQAIQDSFTKNVRLTITVPVRQSSGHKWLSIEPHQSALLANLVGKLKMTIPFWNIRCTARKRNELIGSISSILYPLCASTAGSVDSIFLAYQMVETFVSRQPVQLVHRDDTRMQLYLASIMIAYKLNEETDPHIAPLASQLVTLMDVRMPNVFGVLKMEQRLMKTLDWRITMHVLPMNLCLAMLDVLPDCLAVDLALKHAILNESECILKGIVIALKGSADLIPICYYWMTAVAIAFCRYFGLLLSKAILFYFFRIVDKCCDVEIFEKYCDHLFNLKVEDINNR